MPKSVFREINTVSVEVVPYMDFLCCIFTQRFIHESTRCLVLMKGPRAEMLAPFISPQVLP